MVRKKTGSVVAFTLGLIGIWPIIFVTAYILLLIFAGDRTADFSVEPRSTRVNQLVLVAALAVTAVAQVCAIALGLVRRVRSQKGDRGRGFALAAIIMGVIGLVFTGFIFAVYAAVSSQFHKDDGELSCEEKAVKCKDNQGHITTALGPDMWGFDHPGMTPEEIAALGLSPGGDLINNETGIIYIDPEYLDCPEDEDPNDVDYKAVVNPDGSISVACIDDDDAGTAAGHNE